MNKQQVTELRRQRAEVDWCERFENLVRVAHIICNSEKGDKIDKVV